MKNFLAQIQHLRFLASVLVLVGHALHEVTARKVSGYEAFTGANFIDWGIGVDVFFVISGFVMYYMAADHFGTPGAAQSFALRRLQRVVPLYWTFTTLMLLAIVVVPSRIANDGIDPVHVISSYLFLPWPREDGLLRPLLAVGWTLNYELLFYGLFAACLLFKRRAGMFILTGILGCGASLHFIAPADIWLLNYWTDPIILEFLAGIGIAQLFTQGVRVGRGLAVGLILTASALALALTGHESLERAVRLGVPAVIFVAAVALGPSFVPVGRASRTLSFGGDASYALYLSHPFALNLASMAWNKLGLHGAGWFVLWACMSALAVGGLVHVLIERHLTGFVRSAARPTLAKAAGT